MMRAKLYTTHTRLADHVNQLWFDVGSPSKVQVRVRTTGMTSEHDMRQLWPLLNIEHNRVSAGTRSWYHTHSIDYALDEELSQLFDFTIKCKELAFISRLAAKDAELKKGSVNYHDLHCKLVNAEKLNESLVHDLALARRPWYIKLLDTISGKIK